MATVIMRPPKYRITDGVTSARLLADWPRGIPRPVARRGAKAAGLRFERAVHTAALRGGFPSKHGKWFGYTDLNGDGLCQTDIILAYPNEAYVLECKLQNLEEGQGQLRDLYLPVLQQALGIPVYGVVVVKYLKSGARRSSICMELAEALPRAKRGIPVLHYLGKGPI